MSTSFSRIYYFGDSLTDVGNAFKLLTSVLSSFILSDLIERFGEVVPLAQLQALSERISEQVILTNFPEFGSERAITNAFTHPEYTATLGGFEVENYAFAAARTIGRDVLENIIDLETQIDNFERNASAGVPKGSAGVILIGGNDLNSLVDQAEAQEGATVEELFSLLGSEVDAILAEIGQASARLTQAGVETVYLATLPPTGLFPEFDSLSMATQEFAGLLVDTFNEGLAALVQSQTTGGSDVRVLDFFAVTSALLEDPESFGIVADKLDLLIDGSSFDSDQVLAWDMLHPAETVHQLWGAYSEFVFRGGNTVLLDDDASVFNSGSGPDGVFGLGGDDRINVGPGNDVVFGGTGNDIINGGIGNDIIQGGRDDDTVFGGPGDDILGGGAGNDVLVGGDGRDVITDGLGSDIVFGGASDDIFVFIEPSLIGGDETPSSDVFVGGSGQDTLYLVLDEAAYSEFVASSDDPSELLAQLGITVAGVESILAIEGRQSIATELSAFDWFLEADYWGVISAPSSADLVA
ncbi:SGNH/GDSL hydrolase family protein [Ruegeria profundi]|uniref:Hemolysin n=1 Tax=Ruegeria profundi TaxID=1685378 RepID=A0A0X3TWM0_9RHOB|nr:SGNH/GDSL hydrolase family protein [Ruegeria profundi]KUJ80059.1 hemolysin [Ruegeria profundi]